MTFYLKYRPQNLEEIDIKSARESLKKIIDSKNIPHALLFSGPKGTGKTSTARILAKVINCESKNPPCDTCDQCLSIIKGSNLDVIELDAASNRGIDDVRALKESIKLSPTKANKKIYIIDEAHMMTTEAFNALLKTLEEPPAHVVFILATTNPEKIIDTIHSRCVTVHFTKATNEEIARSLERVITGENIKIEKRQVEEIAKRSNGSFRDAVKMLETFVQEGGEFLTKNNSVNTREFVDLLYKKEKENLLSKVEVLIKNNISLDEFVEEILSEVRNDLIAGLNNELVNLLELLLETVRLSKDSPIEELPLQLAIVKWCDDKTKNEKLKINNQDQEQKKDERVDFDSVVAPEKSKDVNDEIWKTILTKVRPINASIEALLRSSRPLGFDGKALKLGVFYKFHKERLEDTKNRKVLEDVATSIFGSPIRVICTLTETPHKAPLTDTKDKDIIKIAEKIFTN